VMRPTLPRRLRIRAYKSSVAAAAPVQRAIRAAYYRGGTSRAIIIHPQDLPSDLRVWPDIFRQLMGSGDPYGRQLDGMGAGISSLSKICLVESYAKDRGSTIRDDPVVDHNKNSQPGEIQGRGEDSREAHVDYTFVGLGIENDEVDVAGNCGNMSSAIGPYAYNARLLPRKLYEHADGQVTVRIRNTNTGKLIDSTFTVVRRQAAVTGNFIIDGVTAKGSQIKLDFQRPYGSKTGKVLPTGKRVDVIAGYKVTCVDGANPAIFIRADDIGVDGTVLPNDFNKLPEKLELLERIRTSAAVAMGIAKTEAEVPRTIPKIGIVSMSSTHPVLSGKTLKTSQTDLVVRFISDTQPHRAIPLTAALTTAVAARIPGTIVEQLLAPDPVMDNAITIGHASGRLQVNATMDPLDPLIPVSATVYRTAKRIFEGNVYWVPDVDPAEGRMGISRQKRSLGMAFVEQYRKQSQNYPAETTGQEDEKDVRTQQHVAPSLDESQAAPYVNNQPQHTSLETLENAVPRSSLEPPHYPSEEVSPCNIDLGPRLRSKASEGTPEDRAQHAYHCAVAEQASSPKLSSARDGTTWEPPFSGFMDAEEASGSYGGNITQAQGPQARSRESCGAAVPLEVEAGHKDEAYAACSIRLTLGQHPSDPNLDKQDLTQEILSVEQQIETLQNHLETLKIATASSHETSKERHRFSKGSRKRADKGEDDQTAKAAWKREKTGRWASNKRGELINDRKERIGRGW
jgi:2-methylaconitate cis-trans-isomerase PrpF